VILLFSKSAKNIRFAVKGLRLGYYSGASAVIRSAFEDLAYAVLFHHKPSQISKWWRNEFSKERIELLISFREQQRRDAKNALFYQESSPKIIRDGLADYCNKANMRIHPTIVGLSEEFGINLDYLMSPEMEEALLETEGDLERALNRYVLKTCYRDFISDDKTSGAKETGESLRIEIYGRYDEDTLSGLALFAFYIAHRLLDYTMTIFDIKDKEFLQQYRKWHKDIKD